MPVQRFEYSRLSDKELRLWNAYSTGDYSCFDDNSIIDFIELSARIVDQYPCRTRSILNALRLTLSKGITYTLNNSDNIKSGRKYYYFKSLVAGSISFVLVCESDLS